MQSNPKPNSNTFHLWVNLVQFTDNGHNGDYAEMSDKMRNEWQNVIMRKWVTKWEMGDKMRNGWQNEFIVSAGSNTFINSR